MPKPIELVQVTVRLTLDPDGSRLLESTLVRGTHAEKLWISPVSIIEELPRLAGQDVYELLSAWLLEVLEGLPRD